MNRREIPIETLQLQLPAGVSRYSMPILDNEIEGIQVEHIAIRDEALIVDNRSDDHSVIYLFIKGVGAVTTESRTYEILPETIFVPNRAEGVSAKASSDSTLHCLKVSCRLTAQDQKDLREFPVVNTQCAYYAKFADCQSYSEAIKSPNTVSRTILPNRYIPRVAMGTVETTGPDKVAAHEHAMLEQLFLGLANNNCIVHADDAAVDFPQYSVLHIPLGSNHSVSVESDKKMYYVWMDFFLDKTGEAWLDNHKVNEDE